MMATLETWQTNKKLNRIGATLELVKNLESIELEQNLVWPDSRSSPPFLLPKDNENAEVINAILKKSLETQTSTIPPDDLPISERHCFMVHGLLNYYFKHIPGTIFILAK